MSGLIHIEAMIELCKSGTDRDIWSALTNAAEYSPNAMTVHKWIDAKAYNDAAIALLPAGAVWRKYTDHSASVYGASPYNANAQERFDGYSNYKIDALMICGAFLEMIAAPLRKQAIADAKKAVPFAEVQP